MIENHEITRKLQVDCVIWVTPGRKCLDKKCYIMVTLWKIKVTFLVHLTLWLEFHIYYVLCIDAKNGAEALAKGTKTSDLVKDHKL